MSAELNRYNMHILVEIQSQLINIIQGAKVKEVLVVVYVAFGFLSRGYVGEQDLENYRILLRYALMFRYKAVVKFLLDLS